MKQSWLLVVLCVAVVVLSIVVGFLFRKDAQHRNDARVQTCQAFQKFDSWVAVQTRQGEHLAAGLEYYKQHPNDLVKVLANDEKSLAGLRQSLPSYCQ